MKLNSLDKLLEDSLKDIYSAESQQVKSLPRMAKRASSETLKEALLEHLEETKNQVNRLNTIAQTLNIKLSGKKCKGMEGLIEEGKEVLEADGDPSVIDAALIAAVQKAEHYEISAYGSIRAIAEQLGQDEVVDLLQESLEEESAADEKLTQIAEGEVLAASEDDSDEEQASMR